MYLHDQQPNVKKCSYNFDIDKSGFNFSVDKLWYDLLKATLRLYVIVITNWKKKTEYRKIITDRCVIYATPNMIN